MEPVFFDIKLSTVHWLREILTDNDRFGKEFGQGVLKICAHGELEQIEVIIFDRSGLRIEKGETYACFKQGNKRAMDVKPLANGSKTLENALLV